MSEIDRSGGEDLEERIASRWDAPIIPPSHHRYKDLRIVLSLREPPLRVELKSDPPFHGRSGMFQHLGGVDVLFFRQADRLYVDRRTSQPTRIPAGLYRGLSGCGLRECCELK